MGFGFPQYVEHAAEVIGRHGFQANMIPDSEPHQVGEATDLSVSRRADYLVTFVEQQARQISAILA
ncbi:hypothetical protein MINTM015_32070 [Mycobacterium paraintracellulare]|nr:hypothetical protein MINTM015_32070 [Mycobacterium paraintracellulare]